MFMYRSLHIISSFFGSMCKGGNYMKKDSYFLSEELSFKKNLLQSFAILQMMIIPIEAIIDQATEVTSRAMFGIKEMIKNAL